MEPIPHYLFFIFNIFVFLLLFLYDKKNRNDYMILGFTGLVLSYIFETVTTYLGFWYYYSEPKIPLLSIYTWLLYLPYLSFCYFAGNKLRGKYV